MLGFRGIQEEENIKRETKKNNNNRNKTWTRKFHMYDYIQERQNKRQSIDLIVGTVGDPWSWHLIQEIEGIQQLSLKISEKF